MKIRPANVHQAFRNVQAFLDRCAGALGAMARGDARRILDERLEEALRHAAAQHWNGEGWRKA